ncbi:Gfo/Idh/MocA family oxidoreductase [Alisedimentitalea sp. MJ-SS2]|uniref:Gfo/Idh/MocA family protein n=1 Tax=Aliisedimentitalea sp. MJ-SS2 TaxID=3049795 RepID=UPI0029125371|nr:Gfo/Idh/MocA family oxidoreductase [Alisedimentitalea sp. MJ-SS2]MDU8926276.1 Gfo/Idh/MocA family oxidoreductase [Alisedimentitalea sp. MJ-SS2]
MTELLKVGCIGAGYFSRFHYDAWSRVDGVVLAASVDRDIAAARATGLAAYDDPGRMLAEVMPDIVDIITPPPTHLALIRQALAAGPMLVICQKPFCLGIEEAREAEQLSHEAGIPVVVHENFRFQPWYRVIKAQLEAGAIGDVLQLSFRLRPGDGQGDRAYLDRQPYFQQMEKFLIHETAVHWVDTFRFLIGEPQAVFADLRRINPTIKGEDAGFILFSYKNGARALFDGNRLLDHAAENARCTMGEALIEGTKGTIDLRGDGSVHLRFFGEREKREILAPSTHAGFGGDCVYELQNHVARALLDGSALENLAGDYLPVIEQENAIYSSAETGSWIDL